MQKHYSLIILDVQSTKFNQLSFEVLTKLNKELPLSRVKAPVL